MNGSLKYVDQRDIPPSIIEDVIMNTKKITGNRSGTFDYETWDVKVVYDFKKDRYSNIYGLNGDHHIYYNR